MKLFYSILVIFWTLIVRKAYGGFPEYTGYCRYIENKCSTGYCCTEWTNSSWENPSCCSYEQYCDEEWCSDDWTTGWITISFLSFILFFVVPIVLCCFCPCCCFYQAIKRKRDRRGMVLSVNNPSYIITTPQTPTVNIDPGYVVPSQQFVQQGQMINPPNYVQGNVNYPQYDVNYSQPPPVYQQNIANKY